MGGPYAAPPPPITDGSKKPMSNSVKEAEKWKKIQNVEAKISTLLLLKSHNFSDT